MNVSRLRRRTIYTTGAFFLLVIVVQLLQGLFASEEAAFRSGPGPECVSTTFGVRVSDDGYLEGIAATNCETGAGILLSYHLFDQDDRLLSGEGIQFPSVEIKGNQLGFFRIPLNSLRHYPAERINIRFDWLREDRYWFTSRYSFEREHVYRFEKPGETLDTANPERASCGILPVNFQDGQNVTQFEHLTGLGAFSATVGCPVPENTFLTYHLLDSSGKVLQWDVANVQGRMVCADSFNQRVARIAAGIDLNETAFPLNRDDVIVGAKAVQEARRPSLCGEMSGENKYVMEQGVLRAPVDDVQIWSKDENLARIVFDVLVPDDDGASGIQLEPAVINVEARIDRVQTVLSLIPRILPANDYVLIPALVKVERDGKTPTPFRLSMEIFDAVAGARYETERTALSTNPDNTYQYKKIAFRAPQEGVWNLKVGFVFDPYMWYSYIFPTDGDRVVFINPLLFMLLVLLSLYLLRGLLRFFKEDDRWYGKVLTAGAMLGVLGLFGVSSVMTIAGFSALLVYAMLKLARSRNRFRDPWFYYLLLALSFGVLMEAFWSVHYADVYQHGVILSACLHAVVALIILMIARRDRTRRIALATWFVVSGLLYFVVVSYLKFFGEPPRYSVYQYAEQAVDVAGSALVLISPREWLGVLLIVFSAALVFFTRPDPRHDRAGNIDD